jgi:ParB-like chromosome segregation protein Spo0J
LSTSIEHFGLAEPIVINIDNIIIGGHARYFVLQKNGETECKCYIPSRKLSAKEVKELNVRLNKNIAGTWDFDMLANEFDLPDLLEWGFKEGELGIFEPATESGQGKLDEKKKHICPNCGTEF